MEDLDYKTLAYLRHKIAGNLLNIRGAAALILEDHKDPKQWAEVIKKDATNLVNTLDELMNKAK